jgi:hypothetical protein
VDELVFNNPHRRYLGQTEPTAGLPYTNAQASMRLLAEIGPEEGQRERVHMHHPSLDISLYE